MGSQRAFKQKGNLIFFPNKLDFKDKFSRGPKDVHREVWASEWTRSRCTPFNVFSFFLPPLPVSSSTAWLGKKKCKQVKGHSKRVFPRFLFLLPSKSNYYIHRTGLNEVEGRSEEDEGVLLMSTVESSSEGIGG